MDQKNNEVLPADSSHENNDHSNFVNMVKSNPMKIDNEHEVIKASSQGLTQQPTSPEPNLVARLQKQNDKLRAELRELNAQLKVYLDKKKAVPVVKQPNNQDPAKDTLKKELENAQKQLQIYARDIKNLQTKLGYAHNSNRMQELETQLGQKDKDIQKLVAEKKVYEKINRTQEKKPDEHHYESEANGFREEIRLLKQKIREYEEKEKQAEKTDQKKHEYYAKIEEKYREICHQYGIDGPSDANKPGIKQQKGSQQSNKSLTNAKGDTSIRGKISTNKSPEDSDVVELTEPKFRELQNTIKILKKAHYSNEKKYKLEAEASQNRIKELETENKELAMKLRDKEKEANIMGAKISEMKRTFKRTLLAPLGNYSPPPKEDIGKTPLSSKTSQIIPGISGLRKEEKGKAVGNVQLFTDQDLFKDKTDWKVFGFTVWLSTKGVAGLMAHYQDSHGEAIEGRKNVSNAGIADYHSQEVQFAPGDFLKELSGNFDNSETFVQSLSFLTAQGESHQVGNTSAPGKPFKFDINEYEYPAVIFGALEIEYSEKDGEKNEAGSRLTKIGLLIKSDSVEERIELNGDQAKANGQKLPMKSTDLRLSATNSPRLT